VNSSQNAAVVIFGFPPHLHAEVLKHFAFIGDAVMVDTLSGDGIRNWMSITFRSSREASRAVRKNGDILKIGREEFMVGVKWAVRIESSLNRI
jgi:hypothetical protein